MWFRGKGSISVFRKHRVPALSFIFGSIFVLVIVTVVMVSAHPTGPKAFSNGGLSSSTCIQSGCHVSNPTLNDPASLSAITLSGFPTSYVPGQDYTLSIMVGLINPANQTSPPRRRYGFQLSARSTTSPFQSVGTLTLVDPKTGYDFSGGDAASDTLVSVQGVVFVSHSQNHGDGTCFSVTSTSCTWMVKWTAPAASTGTVEFDIAGNSANGDLQNTGDYILQKSVMATPAATSPPPQFAASNASTPHIGPIAGGTQVTINGSNFVSGAKVFFGTQPAATTTFVSANQLQAAAPAGSAEGPIDLKVQNPDTQSATLAGAFTYFDDSVLKIADAVATTASSKSGEVDAASIAPAGSGVFSFSQNNILVTTVGTPSAAPTTSMLLFADSNPFNCPLSNCALVNNTGFAVINRSGGPAHLTYTLRKPDGTAVPGVTPLAKTLDNGNHDQGFITDFFGSVANNFTGTLQVDSDVSVSALTLDLISNQAPRNEALFTSTPVADLTQPAPSGNLIFAQLVDGGGYQTRIILLNTTNSPISGKVQFFKDDGTPATFDLGSGPVSERSYTIQPKGEFAVLSKGTGNLSVGYALVVPDAGKATPVGTGIFAQTLNGFTFTTAGIPSSPAAMSGLILSDTNPTAIGLAQNTGVAVVNPSATQTADVTFTLRNLASGQTIATKKLSQVPGRAALPPHGHTALFVNEIFTNNEATNFTGTLSIDTTSSEGVSALTLLQTHNQRKDDLLTTLPVAFASSSTGPVFFPQLVSGAGYQTQLILLNPAASTSSGTLNFFSGLGSTNGQPQTLPLNDSLSSTFAYSIPSKGGATFK